MASDHCKRVPTTPLLCSRGWLLVKLRYWSGCVSFLNTLVLIAPSGEKWFERGVRESIQIRINISTLNKDTGRYNLPLVWNNTLKKLGRREGPGPRTSNQET